MCGIAGVINTGNRYEPPTTELLKSMVSALRYRGPDEFGMYRDIHAGLGHARLSIVDVKSGQQPMSNEKKTLWIVFNGEIFNFIELKKELRNLGHSFKTESDTEVIIHAYEEWGDRCFDRFNGQWAVAIWNSEERELILSRDPVGICPLFVYHRDDKIRFASEVKAIFADTSVHRALNPRGIDQTFTYWASIAPESVFEGVEEVRPGSIRIYNENGTCKERIFWQPSYPEGNESQKYALSIGDAKELLWDHLIKATRLRTLRSDVPVGSYLSGGIDSSLIAWMGRTAAAGEFRTFSIRFEDAEFDETDYQRMMASRLDSRHEEYVVTKKEIAAVFPNVVFHAERPVLRTASAPLFLLSRLVHDTGYKVVLTGEGADEMLAGYDLFREAKIREFMSRQPNSVIRPKLFERLYPYLSRSPQQARGMATAFWKNGLERAGRPGFSHDPRWSTTSAIKKFFSREMQYDIGAIPPVNILDQLPPSFSSWDTLSQAQYLEVQTLLSGYLISSQGDRMLLGNSVEGRFPFLDIDVMNFCNSLPSEYKLIGLNEKYILKLIAKEVVPSEIVQRKKQPYRAPDAISFISGDIPEYVHEMFSGESLKESNVFDVQSSQGLLKKCIDKANGNSVESAFGNRDNMALVGILSTQLLFDQLVKNYCRHDTRAVEFTTQADYAKEYSHG